MFIRNQKGQSVIIFAVAIMLVVLIGLSVYNLGEALVAKTRFRNMADSITFAGASVQYNGIVGFANLFNINSIVSIAYYLSDSALNLKEGATALNKVASGYDLTATAVLSSSNDVTKMTGGVTKFQKEFDKMVYQPADPRTVTDLTLNALQNYYTASALIYSKTVQIQNQAQYNFSGLYSVICPSQVIYNQGPIDSSSSSYYWNMHIGNGRPKYRYRYRKQGGSPETDVTVTGGSFCIMVADSPKMTFSKILPASKSSKTGKIIAFAYSYPGDQTVEVETEQPIVICFNQLLTINATNKTRASEMTTLANKKKPTAAEIQSVKNKWALMLADYNGYFTFLETNHYDECFQIFASSYSNTPQGGSLSAMNLLEIPAYRTICTNKGLDYTDSEDKNTFYKTLTLKDMFGTVASFKNAVETSINTLNTDRTNQSTVFNELLYNISLLQSQKHLKWNIPEQMQDYVDAIHATENPCHLDPFLSVFQMVINSIEDAYSEVSNLTILLPTITFDFNTLKPPQTFWDMVPKFFDTPIIQLEGT